MADYYLGEIRLFGRTIRGNQNAVPADWHICDGTLLNINQYPALFALIGTTYGGNGTTNFAIPDLRGRLPVGMGQGPGLTSRTLGQGFGSEAVTLTAATMPVHIHILNTVNADATSSATTSGSPPKSGTMGFAKAVSVNTPLVTTQYLNDEANGVPMAPLGGTVANNLSSMLGHSNIMPGAALNYIICTNGLFPQKP